MESRFVVVCAAQAVYPETDEFSDVLNALQLVYCMSKC